MAHQMKTPVTAIALLVQRMGQKGTLEGLPAVERQLGRLTHLEETLLLMSRMDAGALALHREETDVYTLLELGAENLEDICRQKRVRIHVPRLSPACLRADREWTLEAVMNLMKNCLEHSPAGGVVSCDWEENPLYIKIRIWDQGEGFSERDLPHLFERFYRGEGADRDSVGIGLFLARELVEAQNGVLEAYNRPGGGACFELRMYR
nr:HAMP domain-containing sensor histidine kinase [Eubacterium sp. BSD2780061688b_171218_H5]